MSRFISTTVFSAALLAFLLPFGTVSCGSPIKVTGLELATFQVQGDDDEFAEEVEGHGSIVALLALVSAAAGFALAAAGRGWRGVVSVVGLTALLLLPLIAVSELADLWLHEGFVLAVVSFSAAGCLRILERVQRRRADGRRSWPYVFAATPLALASALTVILWLAVDLST